MTHTAPNRGGRSGGGSGSGGGGSDLLGRHFLDAERQAFALGKRHATDVLSHEYPLHPLSRFPGAGGRGGVGGGGGHAFEILEDVRRMSRVKRLRGALDHYRYHPFVEEHKPEVVRDLMVNTFGPFGAGFSVKQHEIVFEYRGVEVLRRRDDVEGEPFAAAVSGCAAADGDAPTSTAVAMTTTSSSSSSSSSYYYSSSLPAAFLRGRFRDKKGHAERDRLWQKLRIDYGVPNRDQSPHRALVTCIPLSKLKKCVARYREAAMRLRDSTPATDDPTRMPAWRFHKELADRCTRVAADGTEYDVPGTEALFALVESPVDLYDLVRPLGTSHHGDPELRARPDGPGVDLLQVLIGGEGRLRLPDDYVRDDDVEGGAIRSGLYGVDVPPHSMCTDAWLVYRQKTIRYRVDGVRRGDGSGGGGGGSGRRGTRAGDPSLDAYPDVDLFLTDKARDRFVEEFLGKERYASHPVRGRPREPAPIIFVFLGTLVENTHGPMGRERVVQYQSGLALHQCRPLVFYPSFVKFPS